MKKCLSYLIITVLSQACLFSQFVLPEEIIGKHKDGELFVRWEPMTIDEWQESQEKGYTILIEEFMNGSYQEVHESNVKPASVKQMSEQIAEANGVVKNFYGSSRDVMYPEYAQRVYVEDIVSRFLNKTDNTLDSFRINMLSYFSIFDADLAQNNGLGYHWKYQNEGKYRVTLSIDNSSLRSIVINTQEKIIDPAINLEATFADKNVKLAWDSKKHIFTNFGFYISKSEDGIKYNRIQDLPYIIPVPEEGQDYSGSLGTQDSLDQNYKTYYYKIRGLDYFGHLSKKEASISGQGFEEIQYSPRITNAEQLENNDALLDWDISNSDIRLIDHFTVMRADSIGGKYEVAIDSIPSLKRSIAFPMEHETNFFRMEAVSAYGQAVSSTPVFIMGMDTIAPLTPVVIGATIDSIGQVQISWNANTESDLWGYRIFKSNFATDEYTLITAEPTLDTILIDTTHLDLGVEEIFYVVQACDVRNNRSEFTEPIIIEKPDIIPPSRPIVTKFVQKNDSLFVEWSPSASDDVVLHEVYRRAIKTENKWTLIAVIDSNIVLRSLMELGLEFGTEYAYTIIAIDDANLKSEPSLLKSTILKKPKVVFEPEILTEGIYDENLEQITLNWSCSNSENVESYLIYKGENPERMARYKYVEGSEITLNEKVKGKRNLYYRICPLYKNVAKTYYGDIVEIVVPSE